VSIRGKLLLVEDSESQGNHIKSLLERLGYQVAWVQTGIDALRVVREDPPDLVVLDVVMRDMDGLAVCRWLKMSPDTRDIPVLMLTVKGELHQRVEGLNIGANDYLPKPFADEELEARIFASLRMKASAIELRKRNTELESMLHHVEALAITDPLTGLFNRRRFADVLRHEFAMTRRYGSTLSCVLIDIDHFKSINDRFGHNVGDQVLRALAERFSQNLREVDLAARYGGEEFAILLPQTPKVGAIVVAERIANRVRGEGYGMEGANFSVTVSIGVACTSDIDSENPDDLVRAADTALYLAKGRGRDRVVAYSVSAGVASLQFARR